MNFLVSSSTVLVVLALAIVGSASPLNPEAGAVEIYQQSNRTDYRGYAPVAVDAVDDGVTWSLHEEGHHEPILDGIIPISHWHCTGEKLDKGDLDTVTNRVIKWVINRRHVIRSDSMLSFSWQTVSWFFCNCKKKPLSGVRISKQEVDEVSKFVEVHCGPQYSGWVFSKKWGRGYTILATKDMVGKYPDNLCPPFCVY